MSKPDFQCGLRSLFGGDRIRDRRAKPEGGDRARSVGERDPRIAKHIGGCHTQTPLFDARRRISDESVRRSLHISVYPFDKLSAMKREAAIGSDETNGRPRYLSNQ